jgi:hypothetical protein
MRRNFIIFIVFFGCFLVSYIAIHGTKNIEGRTSYKNISFILPDEWIFNESQSQFRLFEIILADNSDFSIVIFSNIGGDATQNFERWKKQFQSIDFLETNVINLKDKKISTIKINGIFNLPNPNNPTIIDEIRNNYSLLGGVIEFPNSIYFIKATGSEEKVLENENYFSNFIQSFRLE